MTETEKDIKLRGDLQMSLTYLPGVGPQRSKMLETELELRTAGDLLFYFPYKHIDRTRVYAIRELTSEMPFVQVRGEILSYEEEGEGRKRRLIAHFTDGRDVMDLVWFGTGAMRWVRKSYSTGRVYIVFGRPTVFNGRINVAHPDIENADDLRLGSMGLQPYYHTTDRMKKYGMNSRWMEKATNALLTRYVWSLTETLPASLLERLCLVGRTEAVLTAHYPQSADALRRALYRLKLEELLFVQLGILRISEQRRTGVRGRILNRVGPLFNTFYSKHLPFSLTEAQKRVIREMRTDMCSGRQMNRLLQGDVGSGKTLVALMTMLLAVDNGCQTCLMAPTEILAEQHYATFRDMLGDMGVRVELLTGSVKGKRRREPILEGLRNGEVQVLIGTHAVLEDAVEFKELGLVVIDEQHRFGVAQRARLWEKSELSPHVLVMTATPIPRTLAMTLYGDLDVSVIDELPPGRKPIETRHYWEERTTALYTGLRREIEKGRQAYVVYPVIKESAKADMKNLEDGFAQLCEVFPDLKLSKVHGQMKPADKDAEMARFASGETQILVATTVIEVGVNVPNASVMVIQNAERFGLSQLHQLRGRVGRGADQSYCILVTKYNLSSDTKKRIRIMCETGDGFEIAEADLRLRGPGDLEGTQQSGVALNLRVANLARDGQLVQLARDEASALLKADPDLSHPENAALSQRLTELSASNYDWGKIS